jgi:bifunctional ADP-heptose synthase (sugar kinase/adenylyltransferase)
MGLPCLSGEPHPVTSPRLPQEGTVGGAGDTFIAAFTLALCAGAATEVAAQIGVRAATATISLPGTATCTYSSLRESSNTRMPK